MGKHENTTKVYCVLDILEDLYDVESRIETEHANQLNSATVRALLGDCKWVVKEYIDTIKNRDVIW